MIEAKQRYEFVTQQVRYHNEKLIEAFNLFIRLFTSIFAGILWVATQNLDANIKQTVNNLAQILLIFIALFTIISIITNLFAWWGYRKAESSLVRESEVPSPIFPISCLSEITMIILVIMATTFSIYSIYFLL